ncbi:hypothetical protein N9K13_04105 [Gammaproteobacteria bacterium]|nr:hypothetical protein [Gammaproteobacteria bacterium]
MAIAFAFWCCLYFSEISISNGEIMKKLLLTLLLPMMIYANPTSGWYEDSGDTNPWLLLLLPAIFLVPYLIGEIIDLFKSKPKSNISENTESERDMNK